MEIPAADGLIVLAATPIGNAADASDRLKDLLAKADVVAAEDTRRLKALASRIGVRVAGEIVSLHEHNEAARAPELIERALAGELIVAVTDAGMPAVSDPGYRLVAAAVEAGVPVTCAPGPSAVLAALALSGLATDRFCFEGFLPKPPGKRAAALRALVREPRTMVFYESPRRLVATLAAMAVAFGPARRAAVARELTKTHEEVRRGALGELAEWDGEPLGEIAIVVEGFAPSASDDAADLAAAVASVLARLEKGDRLKPACETVSAETGVPRRALYEAALAVRR